MLCSQLHLLIVPFFQHIKEEELGSIGTVKKKLVFHGSTCLCHTANNTSKMEASALPHSENINTLLTLCVPVGLF